jgi:hypothetical protein
MTAGQYSQPPWAGGLRPGEARPRNGCDGHGG